MSTAFQIISSIYYNEVDNLPANSKDVYISRTWRESESDLANFICQLLDNAGLRLIGDFTDQAGFDGNNRIQSIISSCGGLVAILPHRGENKTSKYMLEEIEIAKKSNLPCLIIADPDVHLADELDKKAIRMKAEDAIKIDTPDLDNEIEIFIEKWKQPEKPHYIFFATDFKNIKIKKKML